MFRTQFGTGVVRHRSSSVPKRFGTEAAVYMRNLSTKRSTPVRVDRGASLLPGRSLTFCTLSPDALPLAAPFPPTLSHLLHPFPRRSLTCCTLSPDALPPSCRQ